MGGVPNIWADEWEAESHEEWAADRSVRLPRGTKIGATLYELSPGGTSGLYHFHHGAEELLVVLRGRPTLREPAASAPSRRATSCTSRSGRTARTS